MQSNLTCLAKKQIYPYILIKDSVLTKYLLSEEENGVVRIPEIGRAHV